MKKKKSLPVKSKLQSMKIGEEAVFPKDQKYSVRTTATELKKMQGMIYEVTMPEAKVIVKRVK